MSESRGRTRAEEAVERSLRRRQSAAQAEVERLMDTGRELFGSGGNPRVADIVAAAGVSIEAFYRYFGSKAEFVAAVTEDGGRRVVSYVEHKMSGVSDPRKRLRAGVAALMSQASRPELAAAARNILRRADSATGPADRGSIEIALADLIAPTLGDLGSTDLARDSKVAACALVGMLQAHVWRETSPSRRDIDHLVDFLTSAVDRG